MGLDGTDPAGPTPERPEGSIPPPSVGPPGTAAAPPPPASPRPPAAARANQSRRLIPAGAAIAAALVAGLVIALSGGGAGHGPLNPVAQAADRSASSGRARVAFTISMQVPQVGRTIQMTGTGLFDGAHKRARLDFDASSLAGLIPGQAAAAQQLTEIVDGSKVYAKMPLLASLIPSGKSWLKIDMAKAWSKNGLDFGSLQQTNQGDPTTLLRYLRDGSGSVQNLGVQTIRGVRATHYHSVIDVQELASHGSSAERNTIRRLTQISGMQQIPVDVWIGRGLVRRMAVTYGFNVPGGAGQSTMSMVMDMFDYGTPVTIVKPPGSQVVDVTELATKGLAAGLGRGP